LSKRPEERYASMGELGRALASWLMSHGFSEDICGTTLEAKWLRGADAQGRAGRAALGSLVDWPVEGGSGVRRNPLPPMSTLPAPAEARTTTNSGATKVGRAKWLSLAGVGALLLASIGWVLVGGSARATSPHGAPLSNAAARLAPA